MWNLKYGTDEPICGRNEQTHKHREQMKRGKGEGEGWTGNLGW